MDLGKIRVAKRTLRRQFGTGQRIVLRLAGGSVIKLHAFAWQCELGGSLVGERCAPSGGELRLGGPYILMHAQTSGLSHFANVFILEHCRRTIRSLAQWGDA